MECCHNDGDKLNNSLKNLRWDSHLNNNRDRLKHGTYKTGTEHHFSKFSESLVQKIKSGELSFNEAKSQVVSQTHYYRLKKRGALP